MPLYEYECRECRRRTEKIQKFSDPELTICPHCGGALERTITAPAVHFAGGGWYKDLYSSAKPAAAGSSGEGSAPAAPGGGETAPGTPAAAGTSANAATAGTSKAGGESKTGGSAPAAPSAPAPASSTSGNTGA